MNSKDTYDRFNELLKDNNIRCTQLELNEFEMYGIVIKNKNKYITRTGEEIKVEVVKTTMNELDLDFSNMIPLAEQLSKDNSIKRLYFMTRRCYDNYIKQGLITTQGDKNYYRLFDKEKWLVYLID